MPDFEPMKPPEGIVDRMMRDSLSAAWEICPDITTVSDEFVCSQTGKRCFPFQDGKTCKINPLNKEA